MWLVFFRGTLSVCQIHFDASAWLRLCFYAIVPPLRRLCRLWLCLQPLRAACTHTVTALTLYRLCLTSPHPPPPPPLSLAVPALSACIRCVPQGSISSRHSGRKRRQDRGRSSARFYAPCGRVWKGKLDRPELCSHRRSFTALTPPNLPPLLLLLLQTPRPALLCSCGCWTAEWMVLSRLV